MTTTTKKPEAKKPHYHVYAVTDAAEGPRSYWTKIGAAFDHEDGQGLTVMLNCIPLGGRITLRVPDDKGASNALHEA